MQENALNNDVHDENQLKKSNDSTKTMIPTRDTDDLPLKKRLSSSDEQHVVTMELVQVLHSKQSRIDELEKRLKEMEEQESQWKVSTAPMSFVSNFNVRFFFFFRRNMNMNPIDVNRCRVEFSNWKQN